MSVFNLNIRRDHVTVTMEITSCLNSADGKNPPSDSVGNGINS